MSDHYMVAKTGDTSLINQLGGVGPVQLYFQYGIAQGESGTQPDQGVDNPTWFTYLMNKGIIDAWAELPLTVDEIHAAMNNFSGVCIAVDLPSDAEQEFNNGQPWSLAGGESPDPNEGHDILLVKYDENGYTFVTWGALEPATAQWDASCIQNAYVFVSKEDAQNNGVNLQSLIAAIQQLGGTVAPGGQPAPQPAPQPTPTPAPSSGS
jgi:hypothetical protein